MTTAYRPRRAVEILDPSVIHGDEAQSAEAPAATVDDSLPEKYRGKTAQEIADMHQNAERRLGEQANEIGQLRGIVTDLSSLTQTLPDSQPVEEEQVELTGDEILADPVGSVRKIVSADRAKESAKREKEAKEAELAAEIAAFHSQYPDAMQVAETEEFQAFVNRTENRKRDMNIASTDQTVNALRAAARLIDDFNDFNAVTAPAAPEAPVTPTPQAMARAASTEGSGPSGSVSAKELVYESDVTKVAMNEPERYRSPSYQAELKAAIKEGRYITST
jgi:hypothetical protein